MDEVIKEAIDERASGLLLKIVNRNGRRDPKPLLNEIRSEMTALADELEEHMYERLRAEGWSEPS